jgi:hypothetical protein
MDIFRRRLHNQLLIRCPHERSGDVVTWLGAVQAQDYGAATWALGMRLPNATVDDIEQAMAEGTILRTHVMRPTWHFVAAADIRWMQELTAPRVNALNAYYYRQLELDNAVFARSHAVLARALQGGKQLTRPELQSALTRAGIDANDGLRASYLMMRAELDLIICSGARRGKQFTYALLDERAPSAGTLSRDEALAELARRFFTSHGPATLKDFAWWSGLTVADGRRGIEMIVPEIVSEVVDGLTVWFAASSTEPAIASPVVHLLPPYDEYTVAYKDFRAALDADQSRQVFASGGAVIALDGRIVGTWKRVFAKNRAVISLQPFASLADGAHEALGAVASTYGAFYNVGVTVS